MLPKSNAADNKKSTTAKYRKFRIAGGEMFFHFCVYKKTKWKQETDYTENELLRHLNRQSFDHLIPYWEKLMTEYPGSIWAERADCLTVAV